MTQRNAEVDFVKAVMIVLVIVFHLAWFTELYPEAKSVAFNKIAMPTFLLFSGYFCHTDRPWNDCMKRVVWLAVPYLLIETAYVIGCTQLPIQEHIDHLTVAAWAKYVFIRPLGPYWYLQMLIICQLLSVIIFKSHFVESLTGRLCLLVAAVYLLKDLMVFDKAIFFVAGLALRQGGVIIEKMFRPSWWALLPLMVILFLPQPHLLLAPILTWLAICSCSAIACRLPERWLRIPLYVGRNTLVIYLFSPVFTLMVKPLIPFLSWDSSRLTFAILGAVVGVLGSLMVAYVLDRLHVSQLLFGKNHILQ